MKLRFYFAVDIDTVAEYLRSFSSASVPLRIVQIIFLICMSHFVITGLYLAL
jgi:hypothetical protein